jgi:hypothetical protein
MSKSLDQYADEIRDLFRKAEEAIEKDPNVRRHSINVGEYLIEARCQMAHGEFMAWIKRNLKMNPKVAERYMDIAYRARREEEKPRR